jgi:hypothetical protein
MSIFVFSGGQAYGHSSDYVAVVTRATYDMAYSAARNLNRQTPCIPHTYIMNVIILLL